MGGFADVLLVAPSIGGGIYAMDGLSQLYWIQTRPIRGK